MEGIMNVLAVLVPAGGAGMVLATIAVARLRRDPGIAIERGKPSAPPADTNCNW